MSNNVKHPEVTVSGDPPTADEVKFDKNNHDKLWWINETGEEYIEIVLPAELVGKNKFKKKTLKITKKDKIDFELPGADDLLGGYAYQGKTASGKPINASKTKSDPRIIIY